MFRVLVIIFTFYFISYADAQQSSSNDEKLAKHALSFQPSKNIEISGFQYREYEVRNYPILGKDGVRLFWINLNQEIYGIDIVDVASKAARPKASSSFAFVTGSKWGPGGCVSEGIYIDNGVKLNDSDDRTEGGVLFINRDGTVGIERVTIFDNSSSVFDALQDTPMLVFDGKVDYKLLVEPIGSKLAIGISKSEEFIVAGAYQGNISQTEFAEFLEAGPEMERALQLESYSYTINFPEANLLIEEKPGNHDCIRNYIEFK